MGRKIFFSYSWKDNIAAMRMYDDLVRSHLNVWRDQIDGKPAVNFVEEFNSKIDECDDFLILDSPNYRHKSKWCLEEIKRFEENRLNKQDRRIIVCLLKKDGDWRTRFDDTEQEELLSKINELRYYDFYHEGTYDNYDVYANSMKRICELFSEQYTPWDEKQELKDLENEISSEDVKITDEDCRYILNEYKNIRHLIQLREDVKDRFLNWIKFCENCGLNLFSPRYEYCLWLASDVNRAKNYDQECYDEFEKLSKVFCEDPRCYFGMGAMASRLHQRTEAIQAYKTVLDLLKLPKNEWQRLHTWFYAIEGMGVVLMNDNRYEEAIGYLLEAHDKMMEGNYFSNLVVNQLIRYYDEINYLKKCEELLLPLIEKYPLENELYLEVGRLYMKLHEYDKALGYFETAYVLYPHINSAFYIIHCHCKKNHDCCSKEMKAFAESLLDRANASIEDDFWKGAICHFILNDENKAKRYQPDFDYTGFLL